MSGDRLPISAFIICQNEEQNLPNCIESLHQCAEIVIVDSGSTDGTEQLIQSYISQGWPIRFMHQSWLGFARQKQFALEQCQQPWCLSLDGDERLCPKLQAELPRLIAASEEVAGWQFNRRPYLIGYGYAPEGVHEGWFLRLIRRGRGDFDVTQVVHEGIVPDGKVKYCQVGGLLHYRPLMMDTQILKENKYSTLKADQLIRTGAPGRLVKLMFNPPLYFLRLYFLNGLWRCGYPGFIHAMTGTVYSFLTESKHYQRRVEARRPSYDDFCTKLPDSMSRVGQIQEAENVAESEQSAAA